MIDPKMFDDMAKKFVDALPSGVKEFRHDMERNVKAMLQSAFAKLDLVTREEFDAQVNVLKRTRAKLDELEKRLSEMEGHAAKTSKKSKTKE